MKRLLCLALALLLTCGAALAETAEPTLVLDQGRLSGRIIGIDPGHQAHANSEKEPIAPGSSEKKAKVSSGTAGVSTRRPEYEVNLEVALQLKAALEEKGYHFTYDDALVDYLVKKSYSAVYGARNLRRCIQKDVEDPMAARIIESYETPITQIKATAEDGAVKLYTL